MPSNRQRTVAALLQESLATAFRNGTTYADFESAGIEKQAVRRLRDGQTKQPHKDTVYPLVQFLNIAAKDWKCCVDTHRYPDAFPEAELRSAVPFIDPVPRRRSDPLHYIRQIDQPFVGRTHAIQQLAAFLQSPPQFSWWLVTGREGAGKSRLAFHVAKRTPTGLPAGWRIRHAAADSSKFEKWIPDAPYLVILDYVGYKPKVVHTILHDLHERRDSLRFKVRVLLLERFSGVLSPFRTSPVWYKEILEGEPHIDTDDIVLDALYDSKSSLHLGSLSEAELTEMVQNRIGERCEQHRLRTLCDRVKAALTCKPAGRSSVAEYWLPLQIQIATDYFLGRAYKGDAATNWKDIIQFRTCDRLSRWRQLLIDDHRLTSDSVGRVLALVWLATLCGGVEVGSWLNTPIAALLPSEHELPDLPAIFAAMGIDYDHEHRCLPPVEPDLMGEWLVRVMAEGFRDAIHRVEWPQMDMQTSISLAAWGFRVNPEYVNQFRDRIYVNFGESPLHNILKAVMGRYASHWGRAFDTPAWQKRLLGDAMNLAGKAYSDLIAEYLAAANKRCKKTHDHPVIVDVMAGGSDRVSRLLTDASSPRIIAVDRDLSRLRVAQSNPRLHCVRKDIDGKIGLKALLAKHCQRETSDLTIGRKALHEVKWSVQQELIYEMSRCIDASGAVILHIDGPMALSDQGRERFLELASDLKARVPPTPDELTPLHDPAVLRLDRCGSDATGIFINLWLAIKDWTNDNHSERVRRYFSSLEEVTEEFARHGMERVSVETILFDMHAVRFNESGFNALCSLATKRDIMHDDFDRLIRYGNDKFAFFTKFTESHLGHSRALVGRNPLAKMIGARWEDFDFGDLLNNVRNWDVPPKPGELLVSGPLVPCPMHVACFRHRRSRRRSA